MKTTTSTFFLTLFMIPNFSYSQASTSCLGVFSVTPWSGNVNAQVYSNPIIDGIVVREYWDNIETSPGAYNWNCLEDKFSKAATNHKKIHLMIAPGFYAPPWVIAASQTDTFNVPEGPSAGMNLPLPLPWDSTYLSYWFQFVDTLAGRFGNRPELAYISLTGPNSHNGEMTLPNNSPDAATWKAVAGSDTALENLLEQAWFRTINRFGQDLTGTGKYFTIALVTNSLPIGSPGLEAEYKSHIVAYGAARYPNAFGIQTNGLDGRPYCPDTLSPLPHWSYIQQYSDSTLTGFQTNAPGNLYLCAHPDSILQQAVDNAVAFKAHFLEIYQSDIQDTSLSHVIAFAHQSLTSCSVTSVNEKVQKTYPAQPYPNPFSRETTLYTSVVLHNATLRMYNLLGQEMNVMKNISGQDVRIFRNNLPNGIYFVRLTEENRPVMTYKIVITR